MSDISTQTEEQIADEITLLKQRAQLMGIPFSNNIGVDTLRERIHAKMAAEPVPYVAIAPGMNPLLGETEPTPVPSKPLTLAEEHQAIRVQQQRDELKLVRLRITNLDPKKKELPGEIFTVANEFVGIVRKYVPYGEVTDDGYHVPYIIYRQLEDRKFLNIRVKKNPVNGQSVVSSTWAKEFALEILTPLTQVEIMALANAQAAAGVFNPD